MKTRRTYEKQRKPRKHKNEKEKNEKKEKEKKQTKCQHHTTRRDVVSGQTEGDGARVAEDVLRVEGFSHKIVQVHQ